MNFDENSPSGSRVVPWKDRRTDLMRPIVDFRHFTKVPKTYDNVIWDLSHLRGKCKISVRFSNCLVSFHPENGCLYIGRNMLQ